MDHKRSAPAARSAHRRLTIRRGLGRTLTKNPQGFREAFVDKFVADKFGEATTHWRKLEDRLQRGEVNPRPLLLIGLPDTIVTFHEDRVALAEIQAANAVTDAQAEAEIGETPST